MINFLKKRWYFFVLIIFLVGFIFLRGGFQGKNKKETIYKVKRQTLKETLSLSGSIDAEEKVVLRFQTSGKLAWIGVKEGDYVKKYQAIASLDQRDLQNRLQKYLNAYVNQRYSFEQTKDDNWQKQFDLSEATRIKAERILKQNQLNLESAVLDVEYQNLILENANLWTPIEGIVSRVDVPFVGVNITPAQAEFEIVNPKTLYFSASADQNDVVKLSPGKIGEIILDSYPDLNLEGKIYFISFIPKTGEAGTVYQIKLALNLQDNNDYKYRLGMTGEANFTIKEKRNVLSVPTNYIKTEKGKKYVFKKINGNKVKTFIKVAEEIDNDTIVTSGLEEGDMIIN